MRDNHVEALLKTHQFNVIISGESGELKQHRADDDRDEFDGYGYERPLVDYRFQVHGVDEQ